MSEPVTLGLETLPEEYAVARFAPDAEVPTWVFGGEFSAVTRTRDELSVVCRQDLLPAEFPAERSFRALKVRGPLAFSQVGVVDSLAHPLASAGISIFVLSTFDTDYVLVREADLDAARTILSGVGHRVDGHRAA